MTVSLLKTNAPKFSFLGGTAVEWTTAEACIECLFQIDGHDDEPRDKQLAINCDLVVASYVAAAGVADEYWFGTTPCDFCGSPLAGGRYTIEVAVAL